MKLKVEYGALSEAPVWEEHKRGKNWLAKIGIDPSAPGGLARDFARRANGDFFYLVPDWATPGVPIEFGADYYSTRGSKNSNRVYAIITEIHDDHWVIEKTKTAREAVKLASSWAQEQAAKTANLLHGGVFQPEIGVMP